MSAPATSLSDLPGPLPQGEHILWQGRPCAFGIASRPLHAPLVGLWFGGLALFAGIPAAIEGSLGQALIVAAPTLAVGAGAIGLLAFLGWLSARTTTYTVTNRRVVMQVGIALPMTLNLPFAKIEGAGFHGFADGSGDLPLQLRAGDRVAYLHLWPHARPWRLTRPEPMLRSVPDAAGVATLLARALAASAGQEAAEASAPVMAERPRQAARPGRLAAAGAR